MNGIRVYFSLLEMPVSAFGSIFKCNESNYEIKCSITVLHIKSSLKVLYDDISSFAFSLECYKLIVHR